MPIFVKVAPSVTTIVRDPRTKVLTRLQKGDPGSNGSGGYIEVIATADVAMLPGRSYTVKGGGARLHFTLPVSMPVPSSMRIIGADIGGWKLFQNAGQQIGIAGSPNKTKSGTAGSIESAYETDCIELFTTEADRTCNAILQGCSAELQ